jgi:hypothetical protein
VTASLHLGIRDAVAALYQAGTALADGRIFENREFALATGVPSHLQVFRVDSDPQRVLLGGTAPIDWITTVRTVIKARADAGVSAEVAADAIAVQAYARVMADQTLGGLAEQLEPGKFEWDQDEADTDVSKVTWDVHVRHSSFADTIS